MSTPKINEFYTNFLEDINQSKSIFELLEKSLKSLCGFYGFNRAQIWTLLADKNKFLISKEFTEETSLLKFVVEMPCSIEFKTENNLRYFIANKINCNLLNSSEVNSLIIFDFESTVNQKEFLVLTLKADAVNLDKDRFSFLCKLISQLSVAYSKTFLSLNNLESFNSLLEQNIKLREVEFKRLNFINNITHELKSPLTSIIGFTKIVQEDKKDLKNKEISTYILNACNRLQSIIEDLLQISSLESPNWIVNYEISDISEIVKESIKEFSTLSANHKIKLDVDKKLKSRTDPKLLRHIIDNLLSNAIKYSPGGCEINVCVDTSDSNAIIKVVDEGIGIIEDEKNKIFERFYRSKEKSVQDLPGTGLGLSICKEIAELLNGKILVENNPDKGCSFLFTFPIKK